MRWFMYLSYAGNGWCVSYPGSRLSYRDLTHDEASRLVCDLNFRPAGTSH